MRGGDRGAAVTVHYPHAITLTPPLPEQPLDQGGSVPNKEEWKIDGAGAWYILVLSHTKE